MTPDTLAKLLHAKAEEWERDATEVAGRALDVVDDYEKEIQLTTEAETLSQCAYELRAILATLRDPSADDAYAERNKLVAALARLYPSGTKRTAIEGWNPEWHGCCYIDLPTGQCSWHYHHREAGLFADLPPYAGEWDGHTTDEKYRRLAALRDPDEAAVDRA